MKRLLTLAGLIFFLGLFSPVWATNGDMMIGVGAASRSLGGVGVAYPQDAASAIFSNPASVCFDPCAGKEEFDASLTFFMPKTKGRVHIQGEMDEENKSKTNLFIIPTLGFQRYIDGRATVGIGLYGVSGMGVDYRRSSFAHGYSANPAYAHAAGTFTQLQKMKVAPSFAYRLTEHISLGLSLHANYNSLDMQAGTAKDYPFGFQVGFMYNLKHARLGFTYISPQKSDFKRAADFDGDGNLDKLRLQSPQTFALGLGFKPSSRLLLEVDAKYYQWANALGYKDFGWRDQLVYAFGLQYEAGPKLKLRFGYNYGRTPLRKFSGFDGTKNINMQGANLRRYYYETFRLLGFPALVEHHLTLGFLYQIKDNISFSLGFMHAFKNSLKENGTDAFGNPVEIESTLEENSVEFGLQIVF